MFLLILKCGLNPVYHSKINQICIIIHKMVYSIFVANNTGPELGQTAVSWLVGEKLYPML